MSTRISTKNNLLSDSKLSIIVIVFFSSFLFPVIINLGPVTLLPYRLVLLLAAAPVAYNYFLYTKKYLVDYILLTYVFWCSLCVIFWFGIFESIEPVTIFSIETLIPYFMARIYINSEQKLIAFAKFIFVIILILIPIGIFENLTANSLPISLLGKVLNTLPYVDHESRLGLDRAQGPFDHPILLGVFCFAFFSIIFYLSAPENKLFSRVTNAVLVFLAGFTSLSSGPLAGMAAQLGLMAWGAIFKSIRGKWIILITGLLSVYFVVALFANSSPIEVAFRYLTFNSGNAWARINIFNYGYASMLDYPMFGHGPNEWARPFWLGASIDMYWLVPGVRYGFPGLFLNLFVFAAAFYAVASQKPKSHGINLCSKAYLFSLVGLLVAGLSVHFWNATYVSYMFVLGVGLWTVDAKVDDEAAETVDQSNRERISQARRRRAQRSRTRLGKNET